MNKRMSFKYVFLAMILALSIADVNVSNASAISDEKFEALKTSDSATLRTVSQQIDNLSSELGMSRDEFVASPGGQVLIAAIEENAESYSKADELLLAFTHAFLVTLLIIALAVAVFA
ncbi:hypothetical protein [Thalassospira xiamenensis]|uniref:hypothetical protein n=1 Tax=Thalassospira xiamenensis TaxID=220697 RepID=UPI00115F515D|nr:hypothetical protein [Thalassospira xiamenensis]